MGVKVNLEYSRETKNFFVFEYRSSNKTGIVYIPKDLIESKTQYTDATPAEKTFMIFQPDKK